MRAQAICIYTHHLSKDHTRIQIQHEKTYLLLGTYELDLEPSEELMTDCSGCHAHGSFIQRLSRRASSIQAMRKTGRDIS